LIASDLRAALVLLVCVSLAALYTGGFLSIGYGVVERLRHQATSAHLNTPVWSGFSFTSDDKPYADLINDAFTLVQANRRPGETVLPLHSSDPFSYGLGIKPPLGGAMFLQDGTTFSANSRPTPEWLVGHATLVLVPARNENFITALEPNMPYVYSHYREIAVGRYWRLFRRTTPAG
jgi:hypothetical protein